MKNWQIMDDFAVSASRNGVVNDTLVVFDIKKVVNILTNS